MVYTFHLRKTDKLKHNRKKKQKLKTTHHDYDNIYYEVELKGLL